jgi:hypothetical protein
MLVMLAFIQNRLLKNRADRRSRQRERNPAAPTK